MNFGAASILMNCMMHWRLKAGHDFDKFKRSPLLSFHL
jgi:hypothetical protein